MLVSGVLLPGDVTEIVMALHEVGKGGGRPRHQYRTKQGERQVAGIRRPLHAWVAQAPSVYPYGHMGIHEQSQQIITPESYPGNKAQGVSR